MSEYKEPRPALQHLDVSKTENRITDKGLMPILQIFRKTIVSLDVSISRITGRNLRKFKGSLHCLETLESNDTYREEGVFRILELLELCGGNLKRLAMFKTKLKSNTWEKIHKDFPTILLMPTN